MIGGGKFGKAFIGVAGEFIGVLEFTRLNALELGWMPTGACLMDLVRGYKGSFPIIKSTF